MSVVLRFLADEDFDNDMVRACFGGCPLWILCGPKM
jgi:hypothetical protein